MVGRIVVGAAVLALVVGCQKPAEAGAAAQASPAASDNLPYTVDIAPSVDVKTLPQNTNLKMLDGDVVQYAAQLCHYDTQPEHQPKRCDLFVQPDKDGVLLGYVAITENSKGVWLESETTLNDLKNGKKGCGIGGRMFASMTDTPDQDPNIAGDFRARINWQAWEKEPGDWMVSAYDGSPESEDIPDAAGGVWYIERKGNNLRVEQERWNYCLKDVAIDEVFRRVVTLIKKD